MTNQVHSFIRKKADEWHNNVSSRVKDDHPDERLPNAGPLHEDWENETLDEQSDESIDSEKVSDVVDSHSKTTFEVQAVRLLLVQNIHVKITQA